jgi:hypothetical protein
LNINIGKNIRYFDTAIDSIVRRPAFIDKTLNPLLGSGMKIDHLGEKTNFAINAFRYSTFP